MIWKEHSEKRKNITKKEFGDNNFLKTSKMDENNLDNIEENLKEKAKPKKKVKVSGKSVFKLQEIIKDKSKESENSHSLGNTRDKKNE